MTFDLYVWTAPRDLDAEQAQALLASWDEGGGDPNQSPFEPSTDIGWFHRELVGDEPGLELSSDAVPSGSRTPIWMSSTDEAPARLVAIRLSPAMSTDAIETIFSLAAKYDLFVFDARSRRLHRPLNEMAAYASATFWPAGAIQAGVAGSVGAVISIVAWFLSIPVLSGIAIGVGVFLFVMAVYSFVHEGRAAMARRRGGGVS